jgi:hypothetical protein
MQYLLAASLIFTVLSTSADGYFGYRWSQTRNELAAVIREKDQIVEDCQSLKTKLDRSSGDLALLRGAESRVVELKGLPIAAGALQDLLEPPHVAGAARSGEPPGTAVRQSVSALGHHRQRSGG